MRSLALALVAASACGTTTIVDNAPLPPLHAIALLCADNPQRETHAATEGVRAACHEVAAREVKLLVDSQMLRWPSDTTPRLFDVLADRNAVDGFILCRFSYSETTERVSSVRLTLVDKHGAILRTAIVHAPDQGVKPRDAARELCRALFAERGAQK